MILHLILLMFFSEWCLCLGSAAFTVGTVIRFISEEPAQQQDW